MALLKFVPRRSVLRGESIAPCPLPLLKFFVMSLFYLQLFFVYFFVVFIAAQSYFSVIASFCDKVSY